VNTELVLGLKSLWRNVFGDPEEFIDAFFRIAFSPDRCRYLTLDGQVVSALYWFDCRYEGGKLAYIYAVATHPEHRGKGLASRLLTETHAHLKAQGYAGSVLKPAKGLFPFYERLGYVTSGFVRRFRAEASNIPMSIKRLSSEDYGLLRRSFLPENGILQEGVILTFLHTFASFYAGEDSLLCISRDEPVVLEYLGNPNSVPGILAALDIPQAEIPTPGAEIPYTMWLPLNCTKTPGYLGITLE